MKKSIFIIGGKLALIGAVSAFALALINSVTAPVIEENNAVKLKEALSAVIISGEAGNEITIENDKKIKGYYTVKEDGKVSGYVLKLTGDGYGGPLNIIASYDVSGKVSKVKLMDNSETAGLGKKAENDQYMKVFENTGTDKKVPLWKSDLSTEKVNEITGASITYYGVAQAVKYGSDLVKSGLEALND